jgi:hypothetical protein
MPEEWFFNKNSPLPQKSRRNLQTIMNNRPERLICFLVVWFTMFSCISVQGQNSYAQGIKYDFLQLKYPGTPDGRTARDVSFKGKNQVISPDLGLNINFGILNSPGDALYTQPADLYYKQSGFFCKKEWDLEKVTHIPFRFRLGSLADCNALEGKH